MITINKNITPLDEILDKKYGSRGAKKREVWEQEFESFKLGVLLEEARTKVESLKNDSGVKPD